ncbi:esterase-like activity of phytase family protein [Sinimarinibacterium sp. CAU 1509]|uniref:esterase-like activity of phytase family protein n=1 Tax=Sinimarinibacterium sp. CAU 1509 TaxID=2562283 RepID=UPI0010AD1599|nr:esterase-like activity of phytase family protein [Sinimarinibacterium sp. CAU 1509]TJY64999.1 esterase-like activity of phytase family protein [Sinimarinibacterium sp. CAU 1509]
MTPFSLRLKPAAALLAMALAACSNDDNSEKFTYPSSGAALPYSVLKTLSNGTEIRNGGFGSGATAHPSKAGHFYAMTDRGPNTDFSGSAGDGKKFPVADYTPRIGEFKLTRDGDVVEVKEILLKDREGNPISGLPSETFGATGEIPYDADGNLLAYDPYGLDSEGLVALADGTFWVSDEYGPHIVHYAADGTEIDRINAFPDDPRTSLNLPAEFANRRANRGMEGLTVTPDGKTLVGIMQSTMYNPNKTDATNRTLTRIVTINLETAAIAQYLYRQEASNLSNSEIVALTATTFLVDERDGGYGGDGTATRKNLFKIDLSNATNVDTSNTALIDSDAEITADAATGLLINGHALEGTDWDMLTAKGIQPVGKTLVYDALTGLAYPHDKLEGLWLIDATHLGIVNDDDFAVIPDESGEIVQKVLPGSNAVDASTLYVVELTTPLF